MTELKGEKGFNKSLVKLIIAYSLFTGIIAFIFLFFLFRYLQNSPKPAPPDRARPTILPTATPVTPKEKGAFCGGIGAIPCPTGFLCQLSGDYPDASGQCVKENE
jgi:hypothetical protein